MRTTTLFLAVLLSLGLAAPSFAEIAGTAHDLSAVGSSGEICIYCHTPHNALSTGPPLWNRTASEATYTAYSSSTFNGDDTVGLSDPTATCMSCHDGTIAIDTFGNVIGSTAIAADGNLGTTYTDDHPIGFIYDTALATADGELFAPAAALFDDGSSAADHLSGGEMNCSTCHDVHGTAYPSLLFSDNTVASAMCLDCHNK